MNERERQRAIDRYLARLDRELDDVPREARRELVEDVRGHIEEAWAASAERDRAALEGILERLGRPEALASEERERLGLGSPPDAQGLDLLGWAAIVLTALFTPVGLILAWLSPHWRTRDKAIATAIALAGLAIVLVVSFAGLAAYAARPTVYVERAETVLAPPTAGQPVSAPQAAPRAYVATAVVALVLAGLWGAPLIAAAYLALRVRRPARRPLVLVPIALAGLLFVALTLALLAPLAFRTTIVSGPPVPAVERTIQVAP